MHRLCVTVALLTIHPFIGNPRKSLAQLATICAPSTVDVFRDYAAMTRVGLPGTGCRDASGSVADPAASQSDWHLRIPPEGSADTTRPPRRTAKRALCVRPLAHGTPVPCRTELRLAAYPS